MSNLYFHIILSFPPSPLCIGPSSAGAREQFFHPPKAGGSSKEARWRARPVQKCEKEEKAGVHRSTEKAAGD